MYLCFIILLYFFFFFSSRRRHTRLQGDWEFRRVLFRSSWPACSSSVTASRGRFSSSLKRSLATEWPRPRSVLPVRVQGRRRRRVRRGCALVGAWDTARGLDL